MKLTVNVDATPQELREFFGLPNVQPLQEEMMEMLRERMLKGAAEFDPAVLLKPILPPQMQSVETLQKAFWDAFAKASSQAREAREEKPKEGS